MRLLLALPALLLVPAAAATSVGVDLSLTSDFTHLSVHVETLVTGENATQIRQLMDSSFFGGNGDGTVQQSEVDHFTDFSKSHQDATSQDFTDGNVTLDGAVPVSGSGSLTLQGATGPVTSTAAITFAIDAAVTFAPTSGSTHTLVVKPSNAGDGSLTGAFQLKAPSGWMISSVSGFPGATLDGGKTTLSFSDATILAAGGTVTFAQGGGAKAPAAGIGVLLACLGMAVVARRRA